MWRRKMVIVLAAAAMAAGAFISQAISQESRPATSRRARDQEQMRQRMDEFRQQAQERLKEALGVNDEEWKVFQPKLEKVQTLNRQLRFGMMGRMFGRMRRGGEPPPAMPEEPQSDLEKKSSDLQQLLQNTETKPEDIKTALVAYREARTKATEELTKAQKELQEVLTVRQEAQLVLMGLLE